MKKTIFLTILLIGIIVFSITVNSFSFADLFKIKKVNANITNNTNNTTEKNTDKTIQIQTENIQQNKTITLTTTITNKEISKNLLDIPLVKLNNYEGFLYFKDSDIKSTLKFRKEGSKYIVLIKPIASLFTASVSTDWDFKEELTINNIRQKYDFKMLNSLKIYFDNFNDAWIFYSKLLDMKTPTSRNFGRASSIIFSTNDCTSTKTNNPRPYDRYYDCNIHMNSNTELLELQIK